MRLKHVAAVVTVSAATLAAGTTPALASFTVFTSRSVFDSQGPITSIDWGVFGPTGTGISTPDSRTVGPVTVQVSSSQGALDRLDEGSGYTGDFAVGDHLLADGGSESDSFIVAFGTPVRGFGTQVEAHYIKNSATGSGSWTGEIELFDSSSTLIDTIITGGTKGQAENNSAPFYGVISSSADISFAMFFVNQADPNLPPRSGAVAINTLDVLGTASVPEPSSLALLGAALMGLAGIGFACRRRVA